MSQSSSLSSYVLLIHKRGDRKKTKIKFKDAFCNGQKVEDVIFEIIARLESSGYSGLGRSIFLRKTSDPKGNEICSLYRHHGRIFGEMDYGASGYSSIIKDTKTNKTRLKRKTSDAEVMPIYFSLNLPGNSTRGLLFTQNIGNKGMKTLLSEYIDKEFRKVCPEYVLRISPFLDENLKAVLLEKGKLTSARMISSSLSSDAAENALNPEKDVNVYFETVVKSSERGGQLKGLQSKILNTFKLGREVRKKDLGYQNVENWKLDIKYNGSTRTVQLFGFGGQAARFPLSDKLEKGANGMLKFNEIDKECKRLENDIRSSEA